jgi:hypothetical protein
MNTLAELIKTYVEIKDDFRSKGTTII